MQYDGDWARKNNVDAANRAQAAAAGCCLGAVLVIALLWLAGVGLRHACEALCRAFARNEYPDPVCEFCGQTLDSRHASCRGGSEFCLVEGAATFMARGRSVSPGMPPPADPARAAGRLRAH